MKIKKQPGFTLIELLLVIVIIASVAAFGLSIYRERTLNLKAEKVAQQMQLILQAASNYYTWNQCWPSNYPPKGYLGSPGPHDGHSCIDKPYPESENFMALEGEGGGYFPDKWAMRHPYDVGNFRLYNPFAVVPTPDADDINHAYFYTRAGPPDNPESVFQLDSGALPNAEFARRVAALLPNAEITSDTAGNLKIPFEVRVQIYVPGFQKPFKVMKVGVMTEVDTIEFTCPTPYQHVFLPSLQAVSIKNYGPIEGGVIFQFQLNPQCVVTPEIRMTRIRCQVKDNILGWHMVLVGVGAYWDSWENIVDTGGGKHIYFNYLAGCCLPQGGNCAYP
jgi:prepilin-type N-terminal cleavage/methylation domain-containing protein